jgi:hypothetical protein
LIETINDESGNTQATQARAQSKTTLSGTHDQTPGLLLAAQAGAFGLAAFEPALPTPHHPVHCALLATRTRRLFMATKALQSGQQNKTSPAAQPDDAAPTADGCLKLKPGFDQIIGALGGLNNTPGSRPRLASTGAQHVGDRIQSFKGAYRPGERQHIAPKALRFKQTRKLGVLTETTRFERVGQAFKPGLGMCQR